MKKTFLSIFIVLLLSLVLVVAGCSNGQEGSEGDAEKTGADLEESKYPERPIEVVVGWGAGGGTDVFARAMAKAVKDPLGVAIPVKNMEGASGAIGGDYLQQQPADGYTMWAATPNFVLNVVSGRTEYNLADFIPVAQIQNDTAAIQVNKESPFETIEEFVEYAKENPKKLKIGGTGTVSSDEFAVIEFEEAADIELNYVPYESAGDMHAALLGGHIDAIYEQFGPTISLIEEGSIKCLVAFSESEIEGIDVPIAPDKGWDVTTGMWRGFFVKAGTPDYIVEKLQDALMEAMDDPEYKDLEKQTYLHLRPGFLNSKDFKEKIEAESEMYTKTMKDLGHID